MSAIRKFFAKRYTKEEFSWILQDWANSVYSLMITTAIFPIFFKDLRYIGKNIASKMYSILKTVTLSSILYKLGIIIANETATPIQGLLIIFFRRGRTFISGCFIIAVFIDSVLILISQKSLVSSL